MIYRFSGLTKDGDFKKGTVVALSEVDALIKIRENYGLRLVTSLSEGPNSKAIQSFLNIFDNQETKLRNLLIEKRKQREKRPITPEFSFSQFLKKTKESIRETRESARELIRNGTKNTPNFKPMDFLNRKKKVNLEEEDNREILSIFNSLAFEELRREKEEDTKRKTATQNQGREINWELIEVNQKTKVKSGKKQQRIRVKKTDILLFTKRLQIMLSSGVTLVNGLKVLANGNNRRGLSTLIARLIESLEAGNTFSESLSLFPKQFDSLYISLVAIGEDSGSMSSVLLDIVTAKEREYKLSKKISSAMVYPAIMGVVLIGILLLGSLYFIPAFEEMFKGQEMELPFLTAAVFAIANKMPLIIGGFFGLGALTALISKRLPGVQNMVKRFADKMALNIPVIKNINLLTYMHNFAFTVSMMLRNGIKLRDALMLANRTINNVYINEEISLISRMMTEGFTMSEALAQQKYFDEIITNIAMTGEESGNMSFSLGEAGTYYKNELEKTIETAVQLIEPMSIILMAAIIVPVVLAVYLPILEISSGGTIGI